IEVTAAGGSGLTAAKTEFSLVLDSVSGASVDVQYTGAVTDSGTPDPANQALAATALGVQFNDANGNVQGAAVGATAGTMAKGDLMINGIEIGAVTLTGTEADDVIALVNEINKSS